jgi:hypothetical protein
VVLDVVGSNPTSRPKKTMPEAFDNGNSPATKRDLEQAVQQLRSEAAHQYNDILERIADSETKLLKAFYNFGVSNSKRITEAEGNEAALRSRLATLEDRILEVERRLNIPPAA